MKKMFLFVFILSFFSCKKDKIVVPKTGKTNYSLKQVDVFDMVFTKNIPVFNLMYPFNFNSDKFSFSYPGSNESYLYSYVFDKKQWEYRILPYEGPNGIIKNGFFKLFENDTLVYFPYGPNIMLVLENNDKIVNRIDFIEGVTLNLPKRYNCGIFNNFVYYPTLSFINFNKDFQKYGNSKLITKVNLKTGKKELIIKVPKDFFNYHSNTLFDLSPEFVFPNDSTIVFIMRKSPNLYIYNINTDKTKTIKYPDKDINYTKDDIKKAHKNPDYMWVKGFYRNLYYDNVNKIYYRISIHPISRNPDGSANVPIRVFAFDEGFNKLAEEDFNGLIPTYSFVNKNGLYICEKNEKENSMRFRHIILEKTIK